MKEQNSGWTNKIHRIITLLHSRDERYWGFYVTRCSDGLQVQAQVRGGESNILAALTNDGNEWTRDHFYYKRQVKEKELFALPYAGCGPEEIRKWAAAEFEKLENNPK